MSIPEPKQKSIAATTQSFYGRSYPRANVVPGLDGDTQKAGWTGPPSANAPLLDWAKKADWKNGGGCLSAYVALPKPPFTPLYAFLAAKQLRIRRAHPELSSKQVLVLAKADAAEEWEKLTDKEQEIYISMAQADSQRYEDETAEFAKKYPDVWAKHQQKKKVKNVKLPSKPKAAKKAWRAFLEKCIQTALEEGRISEDKTGLQRQIEVMKDASAAWKELSEEDKQPFLDIEEEDKKRYNEELKKFPEYKAKLDKKAEDKKQKAEKQAIYAAAKPDGKQKASSRPARKRALPKPKPLVKRGKYVGKGAEVAGSRPLTRSRRAQVVSQEKAVEEEDEEASGSEAEESDIEYDDDSDQDAEESETDVLEQSEEEEEEDEHVSPGKEEKRPDSDSEPELSEEEDEAYANKENTAPSTVEKKIQSAEFVADTPAAQGAPSDDEEEEDEDAALREIDRPEDLLAKTAAPKEGIISWARAALMSGFKGMWNKESSQDSAQGPASRKRKR